MNLLAFLGLLLASQVFSMLPEVDMDNENKLSFCSMLSNKRIYKQEKLDVFCSLKVQQWDDQVLLLNLRCCLTNLITQAKLVLRCQIMF